MINLKTYNEFITFINEDNKHLTTILNDFINEINNGSKIAEKKVEETFDDILEEIIGLDNLTKTIIKAAGKKTKFNIESHHWDPSTLSFYKKNNGYIKAAYNVYCSLPDIFCNNLIGMPNCEIVINFKIDFIDKTNPLEIQIISSSNGKSGFIRSKSEKLTTEKSTNTKIITVHIAKLISDIIKQNK